jgi:hypothetical protein
MACKKKNTPAHPCCGVNCANTCFRVTACGSNANGANVQVYATNATNSILASGNTASNGVVCLGLGNWSTWSLGASATFGSGNDYTNASTMLLGNPCGRSYTLPLTPATDAATNAEANGTVNISFDRCDGVTGWANANAEVKVSLSVINSGVTDANGHVSITVAADGTNSYYVRVYRPTDNAPLNSGTFLLAAGKCADAAMRLSHNATPCNPDTEAVVTVRDCTAGLPGGQRLCCQDCSPDTLPKYLCISDPGGPEAYDANQAYCDCDQFTYTDTLSGVPFGSTIAVYTGGSLAVSRTTPPQIIYSGGSQASAISYSMSCGPFLPPASGLRLSVSRLYCCSETDAYGRTVIYGCPVAGGWPLFCPIESVVSCQKSSGWVDATSYTCDPFSATFDIPALTLNGYVRGGCGYVLSGTKTIPARTITVTEC